VTISIFGNTNNYPYSLALGIRALGYPVKLVVNRPELLHRPEGKSPEFASGYPDWIMDCANLPEEDFISESPRIGDALNFVASGSKGAILNHIGPSLSRHLGIPTVALLTGSDLIYYADYRSADVRRSGWGSEFVRSAGGRLAQAKWIDFVARQRNGILASEAVSFAPTGLIPEGDALLRSIGVSEERHFFVWLADTRDLQLAPPTESNKKFVILNGARLTWIKPLPEGFSSQDDKGTDLLLRGFAQFLKNGRTAELRLVRKGLHVEVTEHLVRELGIQDSVTWLDELSLADFHHEIRKANLVCDQMGASFPGMAALDAMALGRPVLANFRRDILSRYFPEELPVCHADTQEDVCSHLEALTAAPMRAAELGARAREFAERYLSPEANARKCLERLGIPV